MRLTARTCVRDFSLLRVGTRCHVLRATAVRSEEWEVGLRMADKGKALDLVLAQIERQFGKGAVMRMGDRTNEPIEVIPTGSTALDVALGVGGLPRGRVVEVYGPESSGKTTLTLHAVANAQKAGGQVAFVDAEHALDPEYAKKLGVDIDNLILSQPDNGEQALEIVDMLVRSGALDLIVIDSVAALVPRAEIEGEMGDSHVGLQARLMSQALRKITSALNQSKTTAIFINQLREKIGVMFGSPETTTGGRALKFYASVRLDIRRIETLKDGTDAVGNRTRVKVVKNKVAPPFKQAEFDILYGQGISREGGLIDMGVEHGFVRKAGAWYTYEGDQLGQGKENSRNFLKDNPDLANEIEKKILKKLGIGVQAEESAELVHQRAVDTPYAQSESAPSAVPIMAALPHRTDAATDKQPDSAQNGVFALDGGAAVTDGLTGHAV
ncbi:recombination protein RecA [Streptomyces sp. TE5632]